MEEGVQIVIVPAVDADTDRHFDFFRHAFGRVEGQQLPERIEPGPQELDGVGFAEQRKLFAASCNYGVTSDAALMAKHLLAVQFHPEKSHTAGLQLLKNFVNWNGSC